MGDAAGRHWERGRCRRVWWSRSAVCSSAMAACFLRKRVTAVNFRDGPQLQKLQLCGE
jgi:hypothetical protein